MCDHKIDYELEIDLRLDLRQELTEAQQKIERMQRQLDLLQPVVQAVENWLDDTDPLVCNDKCSRAGSRLHSAFIIMENS